MGEIKESPQLFSEINYTNYVIKSSHNINMYLKFAGIAGLGNFVFLSMEYGDDNSRYVYAEAFDYAKNFIEMRTRLVKGESYYIRFTPVEEGEVFVKY